MGKIGFCQPAQYIANAPAGRRGAVVSPVLCGTVYVASNTVPVDESEPPVPLTMAVFAASPGDSLPAPSGPAAVKSLRGPSKLRMPPAAGGESRPAPFSRHARTPRPPCPDRVRAWRNGNTGAGALQCNALRFRRNGGGRDSRPTAAAGGRGALPPGPPLAAGGAAVALQAVALQEALHGGPAEGQPLGGERAAEAPHGTAPAAPPAGGRSARAPPRPARTLPPLASGRTWPHSRKRRTQRRTVLSVSP